jgi:hypothetical protein
MLVVRVELHSARTGLVTEIARMKIANVGGTETRGDYEFTTYMGREVASLDDERQARIGKIENYPRKSLHVWNLVARALNTMRYK